MITSSTQLLVHYKAILIHLTHPPPLGSVTTFCEGAAPELWNPLPAFQLRHLLAVGGGTNCLLTTSPYLFPHLRNGANNRASPVWLLGGLNEINTHGNSVSVALLFSLDPLPNLMGINKTSGFLSSVNNEFKPDNLLALFQPHQAPILPRITFIYGHILALLYHNGLPEAQPFTEGLVYSGLSCGSVLARNDSPCPIQAWGPTTEKFLNSISRSAWH